MSNEALYNNRKLVPEHPAIIEGWARAAQAYRARAHSECDLVYGPGARMQLDLFHPDGIPRGVHLFIHGGYWQGLDRRFFSHIARHLNAAGMSVAIPSYDLCPDVGIADIIDEMCTAVRFLDQRLGLPMSFSGHSAGGHLVASLLCRPWPDLAPGTIRGGGAISGLFDLEPLVGTTINAKLGLTPETAGALSPIRQRPTLDVPFTSFVGAKESHGFLEQSSRMVAAWRAHGLVCADRRVADANHFTVLQAFDAPDSALVQACLAPLA